MLELMTQVDDLTEELTAAQEGEGKSLDGLIGTIEELKVELEQKKSKEASHTALLRKLDALCEKVKGDSVVVRPGRASTVALAPVVMAGGQKAADELPREKRLELEVEAKNSKIVQLQQEKELLQMEVEELTLANVTSGGDCDEELRGRVADLEMEVAALEEQNQSLSMRVHSAETGDKSPPGEEKAPDSPESEEKKRKSISREEYQKVKRRLKAKEKLAKELLEAKIALSNELKAVKSDGSACAAKSDGSAAGSSDAPVTRAASKTNAAAQPLLRQTAFVHNTGNRTPTTADAGARTPATDPGLPTVDEVRKRIIELETRYSMHQCSWRTITLAVRIIHEPDPVARKHLAKQINW
eukprot:TRINITY_DN9078_c0_g1_i1.p1 TRINITY_DN9078_c0_g1~~TRINITY_DN9078_c0_g1_i1.p1  ORF type:complete len:366 (+),score=170.62 TRINITY_DN9078_c0_g1_i1:32-1099(+)